MVWAIVSPSRRRKLSEDASRSRADAFAMKAAWAAIIIYNIVGALDIYSTSLALAGGFGEEANPVMRAAMENFGAGWIAAKLMLQAVISVMVLWFPHRFVIGIFAVAVAFNAGVVYSNLAIAGVF